MVEPFNIRKLKATEQEHYLRAEEQRQHSLAHAQASWHEAQAAGATAANSKQADREKAAMEEDLRIAAEQLIKVRRERLREQYHAEMAAWQRELATRGLTVESKHE